jgi:hypothetical protein
MARYSATWSAVTAAAVADTTTFVAGQAPGFLRSGSASVLCKINEVYLGGTDSASNPTDFILARTSTISVGALTVGNLANTDVNSSAPGTLPSWGSTAATTFPQRSSTLYLLEPAFNTFGGISRWQGRIGEELTVQGTTATSGEVCLSAKTGTGKTSGHIYFEVA